MGGNVNSAQDGALVPSWGDGEVSIAGGEKNEDISCERLILGEVVDGKFDIPLSLVNHRSIK